jgi:hypothetical protein
MAAEQSSFPQPSTGVCVCVWWGGGGRIGVVFGVCGHRQCIQPMHKSYCGGRRLVVKGVQTRVFIFFPLLWGNSRLIDAGGGGVRVCVCVSISTHAMGHWLMGEGWRGGDSSGLLACDGEEWKRQWRLSNPAFRKAAVDR